ncbi:MAG: beta-glucosidase [Treponema sp.]|jgi:beta-glucosidase|nr:beta-glucosidase [Treponema sp.]
MDRLIFPKDFIWGTATASYQVEGAAHEGGRGECIWDTFARKPGAVYAGESGEVACDQYHRYAEDVALMAEFGFNSYRFSIAWPRIIPAGTGKVNKEGVAYYRRLCEELHKHGISACATIYHWDLPQPLEDAGGWANRSIVNAFEEYAKVCFKELGDVVDRWITINEPLCIAYVGHLHGRHAPGHRDLQKALNAVHHINMAHGVTVKAYRKTGLTAPIGITWNPVTPRPATNSPADKKAAKLARALETEVFVFPCLGKGYPELAAKDYKGSFPIKSGDLETIAQPIDFIGINYYFEFPVSADKKAPFKHSARPFWQDTTDTGWPVVPGGLERQLKWFAEISKGVFGKPGLPLFITENGCACKDEIGPDGRIHDKERIEYLQQHLAVCADLIKAGVDIKGYYVWSLLDNFEWAHGYTKRFGIVHVDYHTQKRTPKDSAYFFRDVIAGYGEW